MKKIGDKKIGTVQSTGETGKVQGSGNVGQVSGVKATTGIGGVGGVDGVNARRPTRVMSLAEREQLFSMINEEAEKLFGEGALSEEQKKVVTTAVKMAVDASLEETEE